MFGVYKGTMGCLFIVVSQVVHIAAPIADKKKIACPLPKSFAPLALRCINQLGVRVILSLRNAKDLPFEK